MSIFMFTTYAFANISKQGFSSLRADSTDPFSDRFSSCREVLLLEENLSEKKSVESARRLGFSSLSNDQMLFQYLLSNPIQRTSQINQMYIWVQENLSEKKSVESARRLGFSSLSNDQMLFQYLLSNPIQRTSQINQMYIWGVNAG